MNKQLVNFYVAGMKYHKGIMEINDVYEGEEVELVLEPNNKYDEFAVVITWESHMMGYVPKTISRTISTLIQNGIKLEASVSSVDVHAESYEMLKVEISLAEA